MATWRQLSVSPLLPSPNVLAFDPYHDLLWTGGPTGYVSSYFVDPNSISRYTSYRAQIPGPVKDIYIQEKAILSVGSSGVKLTSRTGLTLWNVVENIPLSPCACFLSSQEAQIVVGGAALPTDSANPSISILNTTTGEPIREVNHNLSLAHLRRSHNICGGTSDGNLVLLDPKTLDIVHKVDAHSGGISGLEAEGHLIFSFGYSIKQGVPITDPLVKMYDARMMKALAPIPFQAGPAFVKIHPRQPSTVFVTSARGQLQIFDTTKFADYQYNQIPITSYMTSMTVSSTGESLAFGDYDGFLHIWGTSDNAKFSRFSREIELPDPVQVPPRINWTPQTPLSFIGMPYYDKPLFSNVPFEHYASQYSPLFHVPAKTDPDIIANLRIVDRVGYALNPRKNRRNQAIKGGANARDPKRHMDIPLFRSEKARAKKVINPNETDSPDDKLDENETLETMPKYYRTVEIKYSKFGVEDFDFAFYNKTSYSGLETHIANSYTNSVLQALRFSNPICSIAKSHTFDPCPKEDCLLCELGFLFRMMEDAKGTNCQASNFLRTFDAHPKARMLGLMDFSEDTSSSQSAYSSLIQTFNRFLLDQLDNESRLCFNISANKEDRQSVFAKLVNFETETVTTCPSCGHKTSKSSTSRAIDFIYPRKALSNEVQAPTDFASLLQASISREQTIRTSCSGCHSMQHMRIKKFLDKNADFPAVLSIHAAISAAFQLMCWLDDGKKKDSKFLPARFWFSKDKNNLRVTTDIASEPNRDEFIEYELKAMVTQIQADDDPAHLVSIINVSSDDQTPTENWHLFNDFLVQPISQEEALSFPGPWKIPAIMYYQRKDSVEILEKFPLFNSVDPTILSKDFSLAKNRRENLIKHELISPEEMPKKGTLIAIDAEFVSLQEEEVEYRSNGTKTIIRPAKMSLARVSVLRGEGPKTGIPFVDDYIQTSQYVSDYVTEFSGIEPGDLDIETSKHTLVPRKVAYKKLRALVDLGCIFIGHGLANDFRIINIFVPHNQIVDTVHIYHLPSRQRKISLRFLAWVILGMDIQSGSHDSIVDARTALQLYEEYGRAEAEDNWEAILDNVYKEGRNLNWRVPTA